MIPRNRGVLFDLAVGVALACVALTACSQAASSLVPIGQRQAQSSLKLAERSPRKSPSTPPVTPLPCGSS